MGQQEEQAAQRARSEADNSQGAAHTAHTDAVAAEQNAQRVANDPNSTPADRQAAQAAAHTARQRAVDLQRTANDKEMEALKKELSAVTSAAHEQRDPLADRVKGIKLQGIKFWTNQAWDGNVGQDNYQFYRNAYGLKVVGGETKINYLANHSIVAGHKWEINLTGKFTIITPREYKRIFGASLSVVTPVKKDVVMGAKWDETAGWKVETHNGVKVTNGPDESTVHPEKSTQVRDWKAATMELALNVTEGQVQTDTTKTDVTNLNMQVDNVLDEFTQADLDIKTLEASLGDWKQEAKSYQLQAKNLYLTAGGDATFEGGGAKLTLGAGSATLEKGTKVEVSDAGVSISGVSKIL
jgi:hypothetical protein